MRALICRYSVITMAAILLASCGGTRDTLPGGATPSAFRHVAPDKRGSIKLYEDTFGDPVPDAIIAGPDGALWFTDPGNDVIGRITTKGVYTMEQSAGLEISDGITTATDNALYFTVAQSNAAIGKITLDGTVTLFDDPGGSFPHGITQGPDGALWFAESNGTVGRMDANGKVTRFTVAASNAQLEGIVVGPDGKFWITEYVDGSRLSNRVIRLAANGKYKTFTVGSGPQYICVGPDKALWFSEVGTSAIGRLTTNGNYKRFSTGSKYSSPGGIATGPDGALWFADGGVRAIGRMTTKGKVKFYALPGSFPGPAQIAAGPDGRMWFTSASGPPAVGRITVGK
jgi:virginiamycin B lyase